MIIQVFTTRANCCLGPAPVGGQTNWVLIIDTVFLTNLINAASKLNTKEFCAYLIYLWTYGHKYVHVHSLEVICQEKQCNDMSVNMIVVLGKNIFHKTVC